MGYTTILANYAVDLDYESLPEAVVRQAKMLTLHTIGVSLAASLTGQGKDAIELGKTLGQSKYAATILSDGSKVGCAQAAFANGTLADIMDWEDCSWIGHPSAACIPSALAVAEAYGASGRDYLAAVVAGYEVSQRIGLAVQPSKSEMYKKGWGLTSWLIYAGSIPAARLMKLDKEQTAQAIGIAGAMTPIINNRVHDSRSEHYHYQHGLASKDGILSAYIAQAGMSGLQDYLDGEDGYWISMSDKCDWDWYTKDLGNDFLIMETLFKHWPANMWIQTILDVVDTLAKDNNIRPEKIAEIVVSPVFEARMDYNPKGFGSIVDAEFSVPYCIAARMYDPDPGPQWFTEEKRVDPEILALAGKVRGTGETKRMFDAFQLFREGSFPEVTIAMTMNDGKDYGMSLVFPKGHPKNPMSDDEFKDRFRLAASGSLKEETIERAIDMVFNLEKVSDMSVIGEILHD